ncbi:UreF-domain-containing protein [Xylaria bambusicola]|uniref:UreF-domain-containing protein n=1 Tax=Xylaria bambusicola TaxID=326684 RepID=UPI0020085C03|nr:UreF-domain-containing protein [Xylaria bambusicola]KAI0525298.1 UreF-domain-containing protein [Xylaria bambusicola]
MSEDDDGSKIEDEIAKLESQLAEAKRRLNTRREQAGKTTSPTLALTPSLIPLLQDPSYHYLLLLSDSALPLGSFAFSSGLESYLAHARRTTSSSHHLYKPSFTSFLPLSLSSYASTTLPFALAAHRDPALIAELDDILDASIICAVGRRASIAQGRALLSIWEKSLAPSSAVSADARRALEGYSAILRSSSSTAATASSSSSSTTGQKVSDGSEEEEEEEELLPPPVSAHLAPLFGAVARLLGLAPRQTAYVFLFSHAKALVSAAVRAGMFGPYQAQKILAGGELQVLLADLIEREWNVDVEHAAQSVPVMDLWIGRHEMLYSRIFNS